MIVHSYTYTAYSVRDLISNPSHNAHIYTHIKHFIYILNIFLKFILRIIYIDFLFRNLHIETVISLK